MSITYWPFLFKVSVKGPLRFTFVDLISAQQLCKDTGCSLENIQEAIYHRDEWRERESRGNPCWQRDVMMMIMIKTISSSLFNNISLELKLLPFS